MIFTGISQDIPLLLTVGSHTGTKGHRLTLEAFMHLKIKKAALVIVGNQIHNYSQQSPLNLSNFITALFRGDKIGLRAIAKNTWIERIQLSSLFRLLKKLKLRQLVWKILVGQSDRDCQRECKFYARWINLTRRDEKRVLLLDLQREDVIAAYHAADLFVFGSKIEYSPLVLFEAIASKTPFLSLACGNAEEISKWTGGGLIVPTFQSDFGMVDGDPKEMAAYIDSLLSNPQIRIKLGENGYRSWQKRFTWDIITSQYEKLYSTLSMRK